MSRLLISGPGHSGGNWVNEICRATGIYNFTERVEDRYILYYDVLPEGYATKLTTDYPGVHWLSLFSLLERYSDLKIIFTVRHPLDNCLSKIVRGMPIEGNEPFENLIDFSYEATLYGSIKSIEHAFLTLSSLKLTVYKDRIITVPLENLIGDEKRTIELICDFLGVGYKDEYCNAYARTHNKWQILRYDGILDTSQIDMYKRWDSIYNGFFKDKKQYVVQIAQLSYPIIRSLNYKVEGVDFESI